jgi:hypothetical protein
LKIQVQHLLADLGWGSRIVVRMMNIEMAIQTCADLAAESNRLEVLSRATKVWSAELNGLVTGFRIDQHPLLPAPKLDRFLFMDAHMHVERAEEGRSEAMHECTRWAVNMHMRATTAIDQGLQAFQDRKHIQKCLQACILRRLVLILHRLIRSAEETPSRQNLGILG